MNESEFVTIDYEHGCMTTLADLIRQHCPHLSEEEREARIAQAYEIYANGGKNSEEQEP